MFLTRNKLIEEINSGDITIDPFNKNQLNPNSYNVKLAPQLIKYKVNGSWWNQKMWEYLPRISEIIGLEKPYLDPRNKNRTSQVINIPEEGLVLEPGVLYLGRTIERTHTDKYVPLYEGRSSMARLGLESHICAGFGDVGFDGTWTLEIRCSHPTKVYPELEIGQVAFVECRGDVIPYGSESFNSHYQNQREITPSKAHEG